MQRALLQSCAAPRLLRNVLLAGKGRIPTNLHDPAGRVRARQRSGPTFRRSASRGSASLEKGTANLSGIPPRLTTTNERIGREEHAGGSRPNVRPYTCLRGCRRDRPSQGGSARAGASSLRHSRFAVSDRRSSDSRTTSGSRRGRGGPTSFRRRRGRGRRDDGSTRRRDDETTRQRDDATTRRNDDAARRLVPRCVVAFLSSCPEGRRLGERAGLGRASRGCRRRPGRRRSPRRWRGCTRRRARCRCRRRRSGRRPCRRRSGRG